MWKSCLLKLSTYTKGRQYRLIYIRLLMLLTLLCSTLVQAQEYLAPDAAFKLSAHMVDAKTVEVTYIIADGYYMYRDRFHFQAEGATLGVPQFPPGHVKYDVNFQKEVETYRQRVDIRIPVDATGKFTLIATGQGCADRGLCYPPMDETLSLSPEMIGKTTEFTATAPPTNTSVSSSDMGGIVAALQGRKLLKILFLFFVLGIGLSLTPCVLPMMPILSSIIVGEGGQQTRLRGLLLSVVYSFGMALVYTILGVTAGLLGEGLSASLQNPWVLGLFAVLMVVLALSMFNVYQLQLPPALQTRLSFVSEKQSGGKLLGVFIMGAISALIVGPCVAAPLAGALVYISQTRDVVIGGSALFAMAVGMSVPLLLIGASAGALLPRAGMWMESVKRLFGVLMLATAWWMVSPIIPAALYVVGWAVLGIGYGAYLLWGQVGGWLLKACGLAITTLGILQLVSVTTGGRDPLSPLSHLAGAPTAQTNFVPVTSSAELDKALAQSKGKIVMLDFYADWCVSCKDMERLTFPNARIQEKFANMILLQIDVTANNNNDKEMLKRFHLFGPPAIIFFDTNGKVLADKSVIGYQDASQFLQTLEAL